MTGPLGGIDLPAPVGERWFEDYVPGSVYEFGYATLSETEIVAFARDYDPQSIHTDPAWSATGPFAGLIASGVPEQVRNDAGVIAAYLGDGATAGDSRSGSTARAGP